MLFQVLLPVLVVIMSVSGTSDGAIVIDANVAAIITALALLVTSVSGLVVAMRTRKENAVAIEEVHGIVNSYATAQALRIEQLGAALRAAGYEVPPVVAPPTPLERPRSRRVKPREPEPKTLESGDAMELTGTVTGTVEPTKKEGTP